MILLVPLIQRRSTSPKYCVNNDNENCLHAIYRFVERRGRPNRVLSNRVQISWDRHKIAQELELNELGRKILGTNLFTE